MPTEKLPTARQAALMAILINGEKYGGEIQREYAKRTQQTMNYGSLYTILDRMADTGWLKSRVGEGPASRGGNRRKYYRIRGAGERALTAFDVQTGWISGALHHA